MSNRIERVLVAVNDSRESLEAARTAGRLAAGWGASVRLLTVLEDGVAGEIVEAGTGSGARRAEDAQRLLAYLTRQMWAAGVAADAVDARVLAGEPFRRILEEARTWHADLIVMAVSGRRGLRSPYVGSQTEHVLEFSECPVLVVPARVG